MMALGAVGVIASIALAPYSAYDEIPMTTGLFSASLTLAVVYAWGPGRRIRENTVAYQDREAGPWLPQYLHGLAVVWGVFGLACFLLGGLVQMLGSSPAMSMDTGPAMAFMIGGGVMMLLGGIGVMALWTLEDEEA